MSVIASGNSFFFVCAKISCTSLHAIKFMVMVLAHIHIGDDAHVHKHTPTHAHTHTHNRQTRSCTNSAHVLHLHAPSACNSDAHWQKRHQVRAHPFRENGLVGVVVLCKTILVVVCAADNSRARPNRTTQCRMCFECNKSDRQPTDGQVAISVVLFRRP